LEQRFLPFIRGLLLTKRSHQLALGCAVGQVGEAGTRAVEAQGDCPRLTIAVLHHVQDPDALLICFWVKLLGSHDERNLVGGLLNLFLLSLWGGFCSFKWFSFTNSGNGSNLLMRFMTVIPK
jgi:hypothetical protein